MTAQQLNELGLDVDELIGNAALEWLADNTVIDTTDLTNFSASAKLFVKKYAEIDSIPIGVSSESIEGLSQSFSQSAKEDMIWDTAYSLLGNKVKSRIQFIHAERRFL